VCVCVCVDLKNAVSPDTAYTRTHAHSTLEAVRVDTLKCLQTLRDTAPCRVSRHCVHTHTHTHIHSTLETLHLETLLQCLQTLRTHTHTHTAPLRHCAWRHCAEHSLCVYSTLHLSHSLAHLRAYSISSTHCVFTAPHSSRSLSHYRGCSV